MLHLRFLGTFHIAFADGRAPAIETAKSKALLAYLVTESDRPHLREQLAALFWPEADQKSAMQSLRQALYSLKRQLQPAVGAPSPVYLTINRQDVAFNFDSEHWSDVEIFNSLIRATQQHAHQQLEACPECAAHLEEAVDLYRGEFLAGLTLPDADEFENWRQARQEWFRAQVMRALMQLAMHYERRRDFGVAQQFAQRLVEMEPWDEDAQRRLIRLYAQDNQRVAAVQQFETVRRLLMQQFDAQPAPETLQLVQEIQQGALAAAPSELSSPYKGLYPFAFADSLDFFGREETVAYLAQRLDAAPVTLLVGSSGSGKSSIIHAGLIPTLIHAGKLAALTRRRNGSDPLGWALVEFRPGADPYRALAEALVHLPKANGDTAQMLRRLNADGARLGSLGVLPTHGRTLIVADQFEELYTLCPTATRRHFLDFLLNSAFDPPDDMPPLALVITLRADFVNQALNDRPLADALQSGGVMLGPMARHELQRAIVEPARNRGVAYEPGLVERLLDDVGEEPGNLPLLQFALAELWERRSGFLITHAAYDQIGRVSGALASYADQVYTQLSEAERATARRLFVQLVQPGDETGDTRRPALRAELSDAAWVLAQKLADLRLVVTGHGDGGESVEIVHEALIRSWAQLQEWMAEDRDFRRWQQRLRTYRQQWLASNREDDALLRGALLTEAERWIDARRADLSPGEQAFIDDSVRRRNHQQAAIEMERRTELARAQALAQAEAQRAEAEHKRAEVERTAGRRLGWLSRVLVGVVLVAITAAVVALWQQRQADLFAQQALARQLAAQSINLADDATDLAFLLGEEALARMTDPTDLTNYLVSFPISAMLDRFLRGGDGDLTQVVVADDGKSLLTVAENGSRSSVARWDAGQGRLVREVLPPRERVAVALAPDATLIATADSNAIQLWDGVRGETAATWTIDTDDDLNALLFSSDGRLLIAKTHGGVLTIWEVATQQLVRTITITDGSEVVWLSPDNRTLAITQDIDEERGVDLWDVATAQQSNIRLGGHGATISAVAFSPDSRTIATASFDGAVRLWDAATGTLLHAPFTEHEGRVLSAAFSPDGRTLATGGADRRILLYDVVTGKRIGEPLVGHDNWVRYLRFDAAGDALYSGATGGSLIRWDMTHRKLFDGHTDRARSLALSPDGRILATAGFDLRILLWDAQRGDLLAELPSPHERSIIQVAYSPDGRYLAVGDAGGVVTLWDVAGRTLLHPPFHYDDAVVIGLAFSPDSNYLAVGDFAGNLSLWRVATGAMVRATPEAHDGWTLALAFAPDGQLLASGGTDGRLRFWDASALDQPGDDELRSLRDAIAAHDYWVTSLLFTGEGGTLISGSADNTVRFWDVATGQEDGDPLTGQKAQIWGVQFFPPHGEQTLLTLGGSGTIEMWDIATRTPLAPALRSGLETEAFVVSPDGEYAYLGSFDARVERWRLDAMPWRERGCAIASRALTGAEWEDYLRDTAYAPVCKD